MANLTGLTTNFFPTASETYANNLSSSISALAATVPVNSANEYTDGDVATITVDAGTPLEATFTGVKASTPARFINCIWTEGNLGVGHASGATVIDYDSATHMSQVSKGILQQHKQSGAHSNITADSIQVNGSIIATGDVTEAGVVARTSRTEQHTDQVVSGGIWTIAAGLNGAMTAVTAYITGYRNSIVAVASRAFTASKDTYVDVLRTTVGSTTTFTLVYTEVANGAASPALAANSIRLAKVITSGAAITSIIQTGFDSLNNRYRYTGSITGTQAPGIWWEELTRVSADSLLGDLSTGTFPARKYLKFIYQGLASGGTYAFAVRFNNDSGNNYADSLLYQAGASASSTQSGPRANIRASTTIIASGVMSFEGEIINTVGWSKQLMGKGLGEVGGLSAGYGPDYSFYSGKWVNTVAQITSIQIVKVGGTSGMAVGSEIIVLGHD